jgi:hypothetical protein
MFSSNSSEQELLKTLLEPLLDDFQYWFERSRTLLESNEIAFLGPTGQADLLDRVIQAQQEVSTAQMLLKATDGKVGVETSVLMPWHRLVADCWNVSMRFRAESKHP